VTDASLTWRATVAFTSWANACAAGH